MNLAAMKSQAVLLGSKSSLAELAEIEARDWKRRGAEVWASGAPVAVAGGFAGIEALGVSPVNAPAVAPVSTTELLLWAGATFTPIVANPQIPKVYELHAWGTSTTAAAPGTFTLNPRLGTLVSSPSMGATTAITPVASATAAPWLIKGKLIVRTGGSSAVATGSFLFQQSNTPGGSGPVTAADVILGGISATFDSTVASALVFGVVVTTSITNTFTPQGIVWASWN